MKVLKRVASLAFTFVAITALTFAAVHLAPGDPLQLSDEPTSAIMQPADERPLVARYLTWFSRTARLDLGRSLVDRQPVTRRIAEALPPTLLLGVLGLLVALTIAVFAGTALAVRRRQAFARWVGGALVVGAAVPSYWVAVMALLALATPHGVVLFPLQGLGQGGFVLPVCCLAWPLTIMLTRQVNAGVSLGLESGWAMAARARGLDESRLVWRHAVPNALVPVVTTIGLAVPQVLAGSVVIERLFGIPGMGALAAEAIGTRDAPVVMGATVVVCLVTLAATLVTDLSTAALDPRLRDEAT